MSEAKYAGRLIIASLYRKTEKDRNEGEYPIIIRDYENGYVRIQLPTKALYKIIQKADKIWTHDTADVNYFVLKLK